MEFGEEFAILLGHGSELVGNGVELVGDRHYS